MAYIEHSFVKCKALALVHGNSPRQAQRIVYKSTQYFLFYLLGIFVYRVAYVFPFVFFYGNGFIIVRKMYQYFAVCKRLYYTYLAIKVSFFGRKIVFNKHYLCPYL